MADDMPVTFRASDAVRISRAVIRSEQTAYGHEFGRRRQVFPPSSDSLEAYIITQERDGGGNLAVYGPTTPLTVTCKPADGATDASETDDDIEVKPSITCGVTFTGCMCWAFLVGDERHMASAEAGDTFDATASEDFDIDSVGEVSLQYIDHFGTTRYATVEAENDYLGFAVTSGTACMVQFIWGSQRFRIIEAQCAS